MVQNKLVGQLQPLYNLLCNIRNELDTLAEAIHKAIKNIIAKTTLSAWPLLQASEAWLEECIEVVKKT